MLTRFAVAALLCLAIAGCGRQEQAAQKGEKGEAGSPGPPGPPGPQGPPGAGTLRFAEFGCQQAICTASCNNNERLVSAYALNPGGVFVFEDDRRVTFRATRRPSGKIVLVCSGF
jgi:hypothetical protein